MNTLSQDMPFAVTIGQLHESPRAAIDSVAVSETGVRMIQWSANNPGMRPRDLDRSARRDLLATLRRNTMALAGIDLWIPLAHFDDPIKSGLALDALLAVIELAEDLNRVVVSTALPIVPAKATDENDASIALRRHIVDMVAGEAQRRGVPVADHTVAHDNENQASQSAMLGPGIDPAAIISAGLDPAAIVLSRGIGGRLKSVRISDLLTSGTRGPIGQTDGQLDVFAYRMSLAAVEYERPIVIDTRQWQRPWEGIAATIETWERAAVV